MTTLVTNRLQLHRLAIVVPLCVGLAWILGAFEGSWDVETLRASVILSLLILVSLVVFWLAARADPEGRTLLVVLWVSFALKLVALYFRFTSGLLADALVYDLVGRDNAALLAIGQWPVTSRFSGSYFVRVLTGIVYFVTGPSIYGISMIWAWLALIGMLLFYKAFCRALPEGNRRLYMFLVLLYPSMLLWTSSLGKDALMMLFAGVATYGVARTKTGVNVMGVWWLTVGVAGMMAIRPHVAGIFTVAVAISTFIRPVRAGKMSLPIRLLGLSVVAAVALFVVVAASRLAGLERLEAEEVTGFIGARQVRTGERAFDETTRQQAGSVFTPINLSSPLGLALLIPTVLIRPFPWEAHNLNSMITALEGMGLLAVILYRFKSIRAAILGAARNSFLLLIAFYALMFFYLFSAFSNFGIIARQRVQVFPFVFMWIAYLAQARRAEKD